MKNIGTIISLSLLLLLFSCNRKTDSQVNINTNVVINDSYIGNGAQWDPYQLDYGTAVLSISDNDWKKLYQRLDFMQPQLMRVMTNAGNVVRDGKFAPDAISDQIYKILTYCQTRNVQVMFGDWGWTVINNKTSINEQNLSIAAEFVNYLIVNKGFTCIKHYNLINEPNGFWSATDKNYQLWASAITYFHNELKRLNLAEKLSVVGPDAAIWKADEAWWADSCANRLGDQIGLYDIHTYPSKITVNSGEFQEIISAYKEKVPAGKKIVMGEIGFKFVEPADSLLNKENIRRANAKKYATPLDCQMFVYDYSYGIDMADALFQTINAGFSGSIVWMLDDAMYSLGGKEQLKIWGFWNILGEEYFGAEEENIRPWFYAWSLLTKYIPAGSKVFKVETTGDQNIKAIAVEKDGNYMFALVNIGETEKTVKLESKTLQKLHNMKKYIYAEGTLNLKGDLELIPNEEGLHFSLKKGVQEKMPAQSLIVFTNFNY